MVLDNRYLLELDSGGGGGSSTLIKRNCLAMLLCREK